MSHMERLGAFYLCFYPQAIKYLGNRLRISRQQGKIEDHIADYITLKVMASSTAKTLRNDMVTWGFPDDVANTCADDVIGLAIRTYLNDFETHPQSCVRRNLRYLYRFSVSQIGASGKEPVERTLRCARTPRELAASSVPNMAEATPTIEDIPSPVPVAATFEDNLILDQFERFVNKLSDKDNRRNEKMIEVLQLLRGEWKKGEIADRWTDRGWAKNSLSARPQVSYVISDLRDAWGEFASV